MRVPHVSPPRFTPLPSVLCETEKRRMSEEGSLVEQCRELMTPRGFHLCNLHGCYPIGEALVGVSSENRTGFMDLQGFEDEWFTSVGMAKGLKKMAMEVEPADGRSTIPYRVAPKAVRPPKHAVSTFSDAIPKRVKPSIFDVVTPPPAKGSQSSEQAKIHDAVESLLAWVGHEQRCKILPGYEDLPLTMGAQLAGSSPRWCISEKTYRFVSDHGRARLSA